MDNLMKIWEKKTRGFLEVLAVVLCIILITAEGIVFSKCGICPRNADCKASVGLVDGVMTNIYRCECKKGYKRLDQQCVTDPCTNNPCGDTGICKAEILNIKGRRSLVWLCNCNAGYWVNSIETKCFDMDECKMELLTPICDKPKQLCQNVRGGYHCNCEAGYKYNEESERCEDVDECKQKVYDCPKAYTCVNTDGHYLCRVGGPLS